MNVYEILGRIYENNVQLQEKVTELKEDNDKLRQEVGLNQQLVAELRSKLGQSSEGTSPQ